jgi:hypothetical protein
MLSFLRALNLYQPSIEFYSENIEHLSEDRLWRLSKIDPLNSNIAFVLYQYDGYAPYKPKYIVKVFHNENQVKISGCNSYECDFDKFLNHSNQFVNKCKDSRTVCSLSESATLTKQVWLYILLTSSVVIAVAAIFIKDKIHSHSAYRQVAYQKDSIKL